MRNEFRLVFDYLDGSLTSPSFLTEAQFILRWLRPYRRTPENLAREMGITPDDAWKLMRLLQLRPVWGRVA